MPAAAFMVVEGLQQPVHLDADQQQLEQQRVATAGVLAYRDVDDILDLGPAHQPIVTQHQHVDQHEHVTQCPDDHHAQRLRLELKLVFVIGRLMRRVACEERVNWRDIAHDTGFDFHTIDDAPYWVESAYYAFTLEQIERDIEAPTAELEAMCRELVAKAINDDRIMTTLQIPRPFWNWIARSFKSEELSLYGRFDLRYDGKGPAKLLEFNADTPTAAVRNRRVPVEVAGGRDRAEGTAGECRSIQLAARAPDRRLEGDRQGPARSFRRGPGNRRGCRHARLHRGLCTAGRT